MKTCLNCLEKLEIKAYIESPAQGLLPCCAGDCGRCDRLFTEHLPQYVLQRGNLVGSKCGNALF